MKKITLLLIACFLVVFSYALKLPRFFSDSMVLQRDVQIPIWGWANPGEHITISFHQQEKRIIAEADGHWIVHLDKEMAGGPFALSILGVEQKIIINNVLIGEVWLCSGQSNMEFPLSGAANAKEEIASADFPFIRHIKIKNTISEKPLNDIQSVQGWRSAIHSEASNFTAVGYFFAKELFNKLHVPIGLINATWGGTDIEAWTSRNALETDPVFSKMIGEMHHINLDSFVVLKNKKISDNVLKVQGNTGSPDQTIWSSENFDDSKWPVMNLPGLWESQLLPDLDGIVWFRKKIILDSTDIKNDARITIAMIDDNEETFINGHKVGTTKGYNVHRNYTIPKGFLKVGANTISIKVEDTGGGGGVYGDPTEMLFILQNKKIDLSGKWFFQVGTIYADNVIDPNLLPTILFNGMINPLIPYAIKGILWYQGENNTDRAYEYRHSFPLMIKDWRTHWNKTLPFYFVQLSSFNGSNGNSSVGSTWSELREAQTMTLSLPNTGMAVTTDIGNALDIHPTNKEDVGKRLSAIALGSLYGQAPFKGPSYKRLTIKKNTAIVEFNHIGKGLVIHNDRKLQGFEIAGIDKKFYPANAILIDNKVSLSSPVVTRPVAVRYGWADDAGNANLFNMEGFPTEPFRTDAWKSVTETVKYKLKK